MNWVGVQTAKYVVLAIGVAVVTPTAAFAVVAHPPNVYPVFAKFPCVESVSGVVELYVQDSLLFVGAVPLFAPLPL